MRKYDVHYCKITIRDLIREFALPQKHVLCTKEIYFRITFI